ncbi:RNA polymerase sigma factor [Algibacter sp. PT7-4]|uniref:RNA polymerase sigma factor n=1 Tax=Algibacter ulvanivorans TaxID=3400999 RepID=UPI003AB094F3
MEHKLIDHLFRHHSGKMVSVLIRIFGLSNLDIIEDAVQDTFIKASIVWRTKRPENPEAWLTQAAKNRVVDIFRKLQTEKRNSPHLSQGIHTIAIHELFLDDEIDDAQLRMIFTACHPSLSAKVRIAFALKTVSGFSSKEIASALLTKEETIKKRLTRARQSIQVNKIKFSIPQGKTLKARLSSVLEVLYLIFNEGFHSNSKKNLVRSDLCGEAMRLCQLVIKHKQMGTPDAYALFALMCFHSSRLNAKINSNNEILDLKQQDRSQWHFPLIKLGNSMMNKAVETDQFSSYHFEAAIAGEHMRSGSFEDTNWDKIRDWYEALYKINPMPSYVLTLAVISIQVEDYSNAKVYFNKLNPEDLQQRIYLYYGAKADYYAATNNFKKAIIFIDKALETVINLSEKEYLQKKKEKLIDRLKLI